MDLTSLKTIKEIIVKYNIKPNKILGQNFLIHKPTLHNIVKSANLTNDDVVLEIGPGLGTLTKELAENAKKVIAIEKDKAMVTILQETLNDYQNIAIIQADILKFNDYQLFTRQSFAEQNLGGRATNYKLVANIPYYLTSPLIRKFLESENKPEEIILMIQKEVAQRICANPPNMSLLAVSVQCYAKAKILSYVSRHCFWPAPKIDSAIIKITPNRKALAVDSDMFFKIVKAGFSQPRKQLSNNLSKALKIDRNKTNEWLLHNNIQPEQRSETLNIEDWINLTKSIQL